MSVKVRISYENPEELQRVLEKLRPDIKTFRPAKSQEGRFKKAYIDLNEVRMKSEKGV